MELEEAFQLLRKRHPEEISLIMALMRFLQSDGNLQKEPSPIELSDGEIIALHSENSMAMAGHLLRVISSEKNE